MIAGPNGAGKTTFDPQTRVAKLLAERDRIDREIEVTYAVAIGLRAAFTAQYQAAK